MATRDAYLYAVGIALLTLCSVFSFTWTFYYAHVIGMMHRIVLIGAIYSKVCMHKNLIIYYSHFHDHLYFMKFHWLKILSVFLIKICPI